LVCVACVAWTLVGMAVCDTLCAAVCCVLCAIQIGAGPSVAFTSAAGEAWYAFQVDSVTPGTFTIAVDAAPANDQWARYVDVCCGAGTVLVENHL
jgi:hypothetical protein